MLRSIGSFLFLVAATIPLFARWELVLATRDSLWIGRTLDIRSGHFFDENTGMVGAGSPTDVPLIFLTDDGGASWYPALTPFNGNGTVSSFFFRDRMNGYATVHETSFPSSSIWRTSDGGNTWFDITRSRTEFEHSCIYETSRALIVTSWDRTGGKGGFSTDGGISWQEVFLNAADHSSNGIGFVDDLHGMVTMGPASNQPAGNHAYITSDGGLTWAQTQEFSEAWSVYALKGTSTFILAPEGDIAGSTGNRRVERSDDFGNTFRTTHEFPPGIQLTGHIDGKNNTLYIQTRRQSSVDGLFRSDDLGSTWKYVGGPANMEDSRFVVTGCVGQTVYAFDYRGNVWKTTDGGDSTLFIGPAVLSLSNDTLQLGTFYCDPASADFTLRNVSCGLLSIDSLIVVGDTAGEFALDVATPLAIRAQDDSTITVSFNPRSGGTRTITVHVYGSQGSVPIDTIVTIFGRNQIAPELFIPPLASAESGSQATIPIFIKPTIDTFTIGEFNLHLRYNTDILSPYRMDESGTLVEGGSLIYTQDARGVLITGKPGVPITHSSDLTKPFLRIVMNTYLSNSLSTMIEIDSFGTPGLIPHCVDVPVPQSLYSINAVCGDTVLQSFMAGDLAGILSVYPNPARNAAEVTVKVARPMLLQLALITTSGKQWPVSPIEQYGEGIVQKRISLDGMAPGRYTLVLTNGSGVLSARNIIEIE